MTNVPTSPAHDPLWPKWCDAHRLLGLFLISVLGLFLELMLIRWIGTEVRIFAYLQNTVLVVCFLALGVGCFRCRSPLRMDDFTAALCALCVLFAVPFTREAIASISSLLSVAADMVIWHQSLADNATEAALHLVIGMALAFFLLLFVWKMFIPIGQILGRLFDESHNTILAYSVNVGASLLGIWLFVLLSGMQQPPVVWMFAVVLLALPFLLTSFDRAGVLRIAMLFVTVPATWFSSMGEAQLAVTWSPYQKLVLMNADSQAAGPWKGVGKFVVLVNNTGYQAIIDLSRESVAADPKKFDPKQHGLSQYDLPMLLHPDPKRVLVVGAGTGNDVAGALRDSRVEHVTAVEIDPVIIDYGKAHHPERPYDSPKVRVVNDDARSYFATAGDQYDLIIFGLLDSHTMTAMTNARLDHYVYTEQSLRQVRRLVADGGIVFLSFEAAKQYIVDRMAGTLKSVFEQDPIAFGVPSNAYGWGGCMFVAGNLEAARKALATNARLADRIEDWKTKRPVQPAYSTILATDDWPYIYLQGRRIPFLFLLLPVLLILLLVYDRRLIQIGNLALQWKRTHWHFFFLGAAFMLLEVQNISKASVALGNTWQVNAVIISGVLIMVLLANALAWIAPRIPFVPIAVGLCGACVVLYLFDLSRLAFLPYSLKAVLVGGLTTLPMLFSGLLFIRSFVAAPHKDTALGANLLGSLVGGLLQSVTFVTGIKALLLIVTGLYLLALWTAPQEPAAQAAAEPSLEPSDVRAASLTA